MAVKYRILKRSEKVKRGDQFRSRSGSWVNSDNWPGYQAPEYKYRRPIRVESRKPARNSASTKFPLDELKRYRRLFSHSCYCDYDNAVGASALVDFIERKLRAGG